MESSFEPEVLPDSSQNETIKVIMDRCGSKSVKSRRITHNCNVRSVNRRSRYWYCKKYSIFIYER